VFVTTDSAAVHRTALTLEEGTRGDMRMYRLKGSPDWDSTLRALRGAGFEIVERIDDAF